MRSCLRLKGWNVCFSRATIRTSTAMSLLVCDSACWYCNSPCRFCGLQKADLLFDHRPEDPSAACNFTEPLTLSVPCPVLRMEATILFAFRTYTKKHPVSVIFGLSSCNLNFWNKLGWDTTAGSAVANGRTSSFPAKATEFMSASGARPCQRASGKSSRTRTIFSGLCVNRTFPKRTWLVCNK